MLLHQQERTAANTVTGYGKDYIEINEEKFFHPIFFRPDSAVQTWPVSSTEDINYDLIKLAAGLIEKEKSAFSFLDDTPQQPHFENAPEILIIGTGKKQRFLPQQILLPFLNARIGIECMDSQAAARTYNVLMGEDRNVACALLLNE